MILRFEYFVLENVNSTKTEYVDIRKIKLEEVFNYVNNLMFDNKVEMPDKLEWFKNKSKLGLCTTVGNKVKSIKISTFYKLTEKQLLEIMAHEMIHAYITQQNIKDNGHHGRYFTKILNELNRKHPEYNITPTEDGAYFSVDSNIKKPIGVILFIYNDGKNISTDYEAIYVNKQVIDNNDELKQFVNNLKSYIENMPVNIFSKHRDVKIEFYKCDNPDLSKFKLKRSLKLTGMGFYGVNEGELRKIREGDLFNTIKLK